MDRTMVADVRRETLDASRESIMAANGQTKPNVLARCEKNMAVVQKGKRMARRRKSFSFGMRRHESDWVLPVGIHTRIEAQMMR